MSFIKRFFLFGLVNVLVIVTISIITRALGLTPYMSAYGLNYASLAIFCLIWGMAGSIISLLLSKFMAKTMYGVQIVDKNGQYSDLVNMVHSLARKAGITTMPEVGIFNSPEVNAFATGPTKNSSLVAVSTGLLQRMNRDEVEGVLGHEVAHIANGDMVTMTLLQGVINAFVMFFARIIAFAISNALKSNSNNDREEGLGPLAHMLVVMVLEVAFGILGSLVVAYFSRFREFRADAGGSRLAGKEKMIAALTSLKNSIESIPNKNEGAMKCMKISSRGSFIQLFSTHPSLDDRISALRGNR